MNGRSDKFGQLPSHHIPSCAFHSTCSKSVLKTNYSSFGFIEFKPFSLDRSLVGCSPKLSLISPFNKYAQLFSERRPINSSQPGSKRDDAIVSGNGYKDVCQSAAACTHTTKNWLKAGCCDLHLHLELRAGKRLVPRLETFTLHFQATVL